MSPYTKKALVLGAGGFIGSHMVKRLKRDGYWVRGVDIKDPEFSNSEADEFLRSYFKKFPEIKSYMNETLKYFNKSFNLNMDYKSMLYERVQYNKPTVIEEIKQIIKDNNKFDFKLYNYFLNKMDKW